jgi:hypothetical protein
MKNREAQNGQEPGYWFNLKTLKVEFGLKSAAPYRVGPFATAEEAADALKTIRARSEEWKADEEKLD